MNLANGLAILGAFGSLMAILNGVVIWQNRRIKQQADANGIQTSGWQTLAEEWQNEIKVCHSERDRLRIEISSLRTFAIALRKVHEGEFPTLPEIKAALDEERSGDAPI